MREIANCARELWVCALPRPGIEPGLEVPETSVMSFSLPGRKVCSRKHYISHIRDTGMIRHSDRHQFRRIGVAMRIEFILMEVFQSAVAHDTGSRPRYL
jgi:hypothetical protein